MKRIICIIMVLGMCCGLVVGCEGTNEENNSEAKQIEESNPSYEVVSENMIATNKEEGIDVQYIAEIKNTGDCAIYFDNLGNSIDLEDSSGQILTATEYVYTRPSVIAPGESAYISEYILFSSEEGKGISQEDIGKVILHLEGEECDDVPIPQTSISELTLNENGQAVGRIQNNETQDLEIAHIIIPVKNADGELCAILLGQAENINAGEEKGFEAFDYASNGYDVGTAKMLEPMVCGDRKMFGGNIIR